MKKSVLTLAVLGSLGMSATTSADEGWTMLPVAKGGYTFDPAVSLMAGNVDFGDGVDGMAYGVELEMNCLLIKAPGNRLRQHISYTYYSETGGTIHNIELNPHYAVEVAPKFKLGAGPGLGVVMMDPDVGSGENYFGVQLGASASYEPVDKVLIGAEVRYQLTTEDDNNNDATNWRAMLKVGYHF